MVVIQARKYFFSDIYFQNPLIIKFITAIDSIKNIRLTDMPHQPLTIATSKNMFAQFEFLMFTREDDTCAVCNTFSNRPYDNLCQQARCQSLAV